MKIFPEKSLLTEEFVKIKDLAAAFCNGSAGRAQVLQLKPDKDFPEVLASLEQTDELRRIFAGGEGFPHRAYPDVTAVLKLLSIRNSTLTVAQVLELSLITTLFRQLKDFLKARTDRFPLLNSLLADIEYEPAILTEIDRIMDETGFVRSSASVDLARIRRQVSRKRVEAEQLYQQVMQRYRKNGWLTESAESWRNGRRVISVFAEQKRAAKGIIHDLSSTGKTCFIEPEEAIPVNNMILELEQEESEEIKKIMAELTEFLRKFHPAMQQYFQQVISLDVIAAKAQLAVEQNAHLPFVENRALLNLVDARHPLLLLYNQQSGKPTIPFTLKLDEDSRILVISGPNAGGKTVCMKTAGLLQIMLQSGFLVTADGNSHFGFFRNILVDIGDSQSLEYELSTYSSRLKNMKTFLRQADNATLFFIDEFGTGTDPALGGALAESILEELNFRKTFGIITTHYMNLKALADRTPGIINGSMAFDGVKLEPLYRLEVGKPGSSYTFVVAERSGLPHTVINRARKKVKKNSLLLEELLTRAEKDKTELARLLEQNRQQQKKLDEMVKRYETNVNQQEKKIEQDQERVRQKELRLTNQLEDKFRRFVRDWKDAKNKKAVLDKYNSQLTTRKQTLNVHDQAKLDQELKYNAEMIKRGSKVRLRNGKVTGVVESIDGTKVTIVFGNVRTVSDLTNLTYVDDKVQKKAPAEKSDRSS